MSKTPLFPGGTELLAEFERAVRDARELAIAGQFGEDLDRLMRQAEDLLDMLEGAIAGLPVLSRRDAFDSLLGVRNRFLGLQAMLASYKERPACQ